MRSCFILVIIINIIKQDDRMQVFTGSFTPVRMILMRSWLDPRVIINMITWDGVSVVKFVYLEYAQLSCGVIVA